MQKNIDDFFKRTKDSTKREYDIKKYFYLLWENKFYPNCNSYWTDKKPDKINFIQKVSCNYIKEGYTFDICGYFPDIDVEFTMPKEKVYKNVSYMKSHLQKSIRKMNEELSVQSTYHIFKMDLTDLLRRLPIIMLEDLTLHESFPTLIWLMIANTKNFKMKEYIYEWILGVVYVMCNIKLLDKLDETPIFTNVEEEIDSYKILKRDEYSILYSIHLRIAYGGMEDDIKMLKEYICLWRKRFMNKLMDVDRSKIKPIKIYIKDMSLNDWDLSAIDFHCNTKLLELTSKKYNIDEAELKKIIWYNSSSINNRVKFSERKEYNPKVWNEIKDYVKRAQKYLLDCYY